MEKTDWGSLLNKNREGNNLSPVETRSVGEQILALEKAIETLEHGAGMGGWTPADAERAEALKRKLLELKGTKTRAASA
jgi:hypothetical protein